MEPITTLAQLDALDEDLMVRGYMEGFCNTPDYTQRDQAYWHGYLNGQVDGKFMPMSEDQMQLARVVVESRRSH